MEIKSFREANEMIKLDIYLFQTMNQLPQIELEDRGVLSEGEAKKVDEIMEFFKRHSKEHERNRNDE